MHLPDTQPFQVFRVDNTLFAAHPCGLQIRVALRFERFADFDERGTTTDETEKLTTRKSHGFRTDDPVETA